MTAIGFKNSSVTLEMRMIPIIIAGIGVIAVGARLAGDVHAVPDCQWHVQICETEQPVIHEGPHGEPNAPEQQSRPTIEIGTSGSTTPVTATIGDMLKR